MTYYFLHIICGTGGKHFRTTYTCYYEIQRYIFTARQQICGKVMFSNLSVCSHWGPMWAWHMMLRGPSPLLWTWDLTLQNPLPGPWKRDLSVQGLTDPRTLRHGISLYRDHYHWCWHFVIKTEDLFKLERPPNSQVVLITGCYWSMYGWQVGGTHPTGMLSCCLTSVFKGVEANYISRSTSLLDRNTCGIIQWFRILWIEDHGKKPRKFSGEVLNLSSVNQCKSNKTQHWQTLCRMLRWTVTKGFKLLLLGNSIVKHVLGTRKLAILWTYNQESEDILQPVQCSTWTFHSNFLWF